MWVGALELSLSPMVCYNFLFSNKGILDFEWETWKWGEFLCKEEVPNLDTNILEGLLYLGNVCFGVAPRTYFGITCI